MVRRSKLWYLPVREHSPAIVAPVTEGGASSSMDVSPEILRLTPKEMDEAMRMSKEDDAVLEGVPDAATFDAQYLTAHRRDRKAYTYRSVRKTDPFTKEQVLRRTTWCARTGAILEDAFLADCPAGWSWNRRLPGAVPRPLVTKFWHQPRAHGPVEIVSREQIVEPSPALPVPGEVSEEMKEAHAVSHCPFATWCEHCIKGRSRGELHHRRQPMDDE
eukprot:6477702-Amphidinium_carterae.1